MEGAFAGQLELVCCVCDFLYILAHVHRSLQKHKHINNAVIGSVSLVLPTQTALPLQIFSRKRVAKRIELP